MSDRRSPPSKTRDRFKIALPGRRQARQPRAAAGWL